MSATILSRIVELDELIPPVDIEREGEKLVFLRKDVQRLISWVFQHADIVDEDCLDDWLENEYNKFHNLFDELPSYCADVKDWKAGEGRESGDIGVTSALRESERIILPRKSWNMSENRPFSRFISSQGEMLRELMRTIYYNLEGIKHQGPKLHVPATKFQIKYVIGGERFRTRPEGSVTVGPLADYMPIISFARWFEGHTWSEFLGETLSVMLGQLARNITLLGSRGLQDQEVFVIGFHGFHLHIARGFFTTAVIERVHSKGCSIDDVFELNFTRGYNFCLKKDWFEATVLWQGCFDIY